MSENTPDRLKAFRDEHASKPSSGPRAAFALAIGVLLGAASTLAALQFTSTGPRAGHGGAPVDRARELALLYESKDLPEAAIASYNDYLERAPLSARERAAVTYSIAKLAMEMDDYERALTYLYEGEFLDPDADIRDERSGHIVHCLEQLGRASTLRRELKSRTGPDPNRGQESGAVVLAEFGGESVTDRDLGRKLDEMPPAMREAYSATEKQVELLKNLVAERLLLDKAFRLKLDENEELQARMKAMRDSFLVQALMEDEVRKNVSITPQDVERFYKAEQARFRQPASARVSVAQADSESEAAAITTFNDATIVVRDGEDLRGLPNSPEIVSAILGAETGAIAGPFEIEGRYFVFKVVGKTPERVAPFEEVKSHAERLLRAEKERELAALLVEETLQARNVKLYPERLQADSER